MNTSWRKLLACYLGAFLAVSAWGVLPARAGTLQITSLGTGNSVVLNNTDTATGAVPAADDRGGVALSSTHAFYISDDNPSRTGPAPVRAALPGLSGMTVLSPSVVGDGIFNDPASLQLYQFLNGSSPINYGLHSNTNVINITGIRPMLADGSGPSGADIALSSSIAITPGTGDNGVFAGNGIVRVFQKTSGGGGTPTGTVHEINLSNGTVTNMGSVTIPITASESWAVWGVAESFGGDEYLTAFAQGFVGAVVRTRISDGAQTTVASFGGGTTSDAAAFALDAVNGRWLVHGEGGGSAFSGTTNEWMWIADATADAPVPEPSSFVLAALGLAGLGWFGLRRQV